MAESLLAETRPLSEDQLATVALTVQMWSAGPRPTLDPATRLYRRWESDR